MKKREYVNMLMSLYQDMQEANNDQMEMQVKNKDCPDNHAENQFSYTMLHNMETIIHKVARSKFLP